MNENRVGFSGSSCKGDWSKNTLGDSSVNYSLWSILQPTSRRFLRELDEAPRGNNLPYIYYSVLASLHWVTRVWINESALEGNRVLLEW